MSAPDNHDRHSHHHHNLIDPDAGDRRVLWAVGVNVVLTLAQVVGGVLAGSLALIADALHNFSDAVSLGIAFAARKIARRTTDSTMTFGYARAEIVAALVNYTTLIVIGVYLVYEGVMRLVEPEPVAGWLIVIVATIALAVDLATAALTYALSKSSMNIRAAFLHNVADALGTVAVIVAGALIILFDWRIVDPLLTLMIAGYILWQAFAEIGGSIRMLMLGTPPELDVNALVEGMRGVDGVRDVHHVHVWALDERRIALEAHVVIDDDAGEQAEGVKNRIKALARARFRIGHSTLEIERSSCACNGDDAQVIGHRI
ncbi:MAG TPA: cation diffusion facilitator family transporter [Methylomirabilota bacterium]|nr:cation diffusion facilitator family transporter [Methylomirabilota bacterium]